MGRSSKEYNIETPKIYCPVSTLIHPIFVSTIFVRSIPFRSAWLSPETTFTFTNPHLDLLMCISSPPHSCMYEHEDDSYRLDGFEMLRNSTSPQMIRVCFAAKRGQRDHLHFSSIYDESWLLATCSDSDWINVSLALHPRSFLTGMSFWVYCSVRVVP